MILVACVGNIFLGDDAFGAEVAARMKDKTLPEGVRLIDFGIRGVDFLYELLNNHFELVIIVDAVHRGGAPGTLYVIAPEIDDSRDDEALLDPHNLNPGQVLSAARSMGAQMDCVRLVGCEAGPHVNPDDAGMGLSKPIAASVDAAIEIVESLIREAVA